MPASPTSSRGSSSPFDTATVTLTDAQIKALPTTNVQLVAAPGAGKVLVPILAWMHLTWVADYTNIGSTSTIAVVYGTASASPLGNLSEQAGSKVSDLLADGASHAGFLPARSYYDSSFAVAGPTSGFGQFADDPDPVNAALNLHAVNAGTHTGDYTGGDVGNSLKITVYYATFTN